MRTAGGGPYAASGSATEQAFLATDAASLAKLFSTHVGGQPVPQIDFTRESAVLLLGGERPTGGWRVVPKSVRVEKKVLIVEAVVEGPPAGSMTTQALTYPWAVIAVSPASVESVRWDTSRAQ